MVLSLCEMRGRGCEGVCVIEKERERDNYRDGDGERQKERE